MRTDSNYFEQLLILDGIKLFSNFDQFFVLNMPEENILCSVVMTYSFFELRKSTICVKRDQMNVFLFFLQRGGILQ